MSGSTIGGMKGLSLAYRDPEVIRDSKSAKLRQAEALERIADTLDRMLAVMLDEGEPEAVDPGATLDDPSDPRDLPLSFDPREEHHLTL